MRVFLTQRCDFFLQIPIESQFVENLANALNAEITLGTIANEHEAVLWLTYTYFFVRLFRYTDVTQPVSKFRICCRSPLAYGVTQEQLASDPTLLEFRRQLVSQVRVSLTNRYLTLHRYFWRKHFSPNFRLRTI